MPARDIGAAFACRGLATVAALIAHYKQVAGLFASQVRSSILYTVCLMLARLTNSVLP